MTSISNPRFGHEEEWEKGARGVDARVYPWGDDYDGSYANCNVSHPQGPKIRAPGSFPVDESPYGMMDLGGNMETWCWNAPEELFRTFRCARGGAWTRASKHGSAAFRHADAPMIISRTFGVRLAVSPTRILARNKVRVLFPGGR